MEIRVAAWLPITAPIPADRLHDCYVWAMQNRNPQYPLSALELVDAWKHLLDRAETEGTSELRSDRLLPERAATACGRCYKKKDGKGNIVECLEIHPDGSIGGICDHRPLSEEEKAEASRKRVDFLAQMQRESRQRLEARRQAELAAKEEEVKPKEHHLFCSNCQRRVSTLAGWTEGETCRDFLKEQSESCPKCSQAAGVLSLGKMTCRECFHTYDMILCDGRIGTATA
jgi:hypothetical protein